MEQVSRLEMALNCEKIEIPILTFHILFTTCTLNCIFDTGKGFAGKILQINIKNKKWVGVSNQTSFKSMKTVFWNHYVLVITAEAASVSRKQMLKMRFCRLIF